MASTTESAQLHETNLPHLRDECKALAEWLQQSAVFKERERGLIECVDPDLKIKAEPLFKKLGIAGAKYCVWHITGRIYFKSTRYPYNALPLGLDDGEPDAKIETENKSIPVKVANLVRIGRPVNLTPGWYCLMLLESGPAAPSRQSQVPKQIKTEPSKAPPSGQSQGSKQIKTEPKTPPSPS
ncbi:hypothetical protein PRK78_002350 [Emydomyces testavorans]|uniref:Uncharacterized protein n=1 Tax=Emydomyces testavorans TaxID=2070801 RepID=A0AAF0IHI0_9EURO|nr:hypothetical protein PRK78_002350 [Emydomyces testavorans]